MGFNIEVNHDDRLVLYTHTGTLRREDIGQAWEEFLQLEEFTREGYNLLSDYSGAKFDARDEDIDFITGYLIKLKEILTGKKQALLVEDPESTALSMMFEGRVVEEVGFLVKVFSTRKAAYSWLIT